MNERVVKECMAPSVGDAIRKMILAASTTVKTVLLEPLTPTGVPEVAVQTAVLIIDAYVQTSKLLSLVAPLIDLLKNEPVWSTLTPLRAARDSR